MQSQYYLIFSKKFSCRNKQNPTDFIRERLFPFHDLIFFLLNMNNNSYQDELDRYFQIVHQKDVPERILYKANLSKARAKLKYEAFIELNDHMTRFSYESFNPETWFGFNLLAVDGTTLHVPDEHPIASHFGVWNSTKGQTPFLKARASQMVKGNDGFHLLSRYPLDV